ncbi:MAG: cysteine protease [Rhizobacter sp.]|nr:cysteine protease [Rhizobacter sp.]
MRRLLRTSATLAVLGTVLGTVPGTVSGASAAAVGSSAVPGLAPCRVEGISHAVSCGNLSRPLDPSTPNGTRITIRYVVVPALSRQKLDDPVFMIAGGPGQSAIDIAGSVLPLMMRMNNRRDIVFVDQRGTGSSAPLSCEDAAGESGTVADQADPSVQAAMLARCRATLQKLPYGDLRFFTTVIAVQDLDAVRAELGADRIDLIGASYGTRVALDYLRQYPVHVRRVVLDGVAPADMALPASFSTDGQAAFDALLAACDDTSTSASSIRGDGPGAGSGSAVATTRSNACAAAYPHLRADWQSLLRGLPREATLQNPLSGQAEHFTLTRDMLLGLLRGPLYVPALAAGLPYAITEAAQGRLAPLAGLASTLDGGKRGAPAMGMHYSVVCAEDVPRLASSRDRPGGDFGTAAAESYQKVCADWPRGAVPDAFYKTPASRSPVLLLSGGLDPATPPRHAAEAAAALGAMAVRVTVPNAGHGTWGVGCTRDLVFAFIDADTDDKALKPDTTCLLNVPRPPAFEPVLRPAGGLQMPRAGVSGSVVGRTADGSFTSGAHTRSAHEPQPATGARRGAMEGAR